MIVAIKEDTTPFVEIMEEDQFLPGSDEPRYMNDCQSIETNLTSGIESIFEDFRAGSGGPYRSSMLLYQSIERHSHFSELEL